MSIMYRHGMRTCAFIAIEQQNSSAVPIIGGVVGAVVVAILVVVVVILVVAIVMRKQGRTNFLIVNNVTLLGFKESGAMSRYAYNVINHCILLIF